jgi:NAD(P)-dependent dehydrogenase (short-subunit alcohol dehydrogenase family)
MKIRSAIALRLRWVVAGGHGRPEEQAGAILFLLSELAGCVTGQSLLVDAGLNLNWTHLGADNTSLFLKNEDFSAAIKR